MSGTYSGAWKRTTLPQSLVPLKPGIDAQHSAPTDQLDPNAVDHTGAPGMPVEWAGGQYVQLFVPSMFVDQTPVSHEVGVGFLPGVDQDTAQQLGARARADDQGAMDARDFERPRYQDEGSTHGVIVNGDLAGESPDTLKYLEKGVGVGIDPYARSNTHITHAHTGPATYDSRWYDSQMRPRYLHVAQGSETRPAVAGRDVNAPPEGAGFIMRADNWAAPVLRRSADSWDQAFATDDLQPGTTDFGLGSWGL